MCGGSTNIAGSVVVGGGGGPLLGLALLLLPYGDLHGGHAAAQGAQPADERSDQYNTLQYSIVQYLTSAAISSRVSQTGGGSGVALRPGISGR